MATGSAGSTAAVYDYIVIGAGSAGAVIAARLSADPMCRVALIEAGPPDRDPRIRIPAAFSELFDSRLDWGYRTVQQPALGGRRVFWPRGTTLGGSCSIKAMMWVRGFPAGYEEWGRAAGPAWGPDEIVRHLVRIESFTAAPDGGDHGTAGPLHVTDQRSPHPLTDRFVAACRTLDIAATRAAVTQHEGRRWSTADAYLKPVRGRPNLVVLTDALATGIRFQGRRATGVDYLDTGRRSGPRRVSISVRREVILCGGAVNSPHLLLLSGI